MAFCCWLFFVSWSFSLGIWEFLLFRGLLLHSPPFEIFDLLGCITARKPRKPFQTWIFDFSNEIYDFTSFSRMFFDNICKVWYWAEFSSVDISCESNAKRAESTANSKIWERLALAEQIREVPKSCEKVVLQRGDHMVHVVPPLVWGRIFKCGYLVLIKCQASGIKGKQQDLGAFGLGWADQWSSEEFPNSRFTKGGPHGSCGPPLWYWVEFSSADISCESCNKRSESTPKRRIYEPLAFCIKIRSILKSCRSLVYEGMDPMTHVVPSLVFDGIFKCGNFLLIECQTIGILRQTAGFGDLWCLLTRSEVFRRVGEMSFFNVGTHDSCVFPLFFWTAFPSVVVFFQWSTNKSDSKPRNRIWEALAFADKIRDVSKSCQNVVLQRGDHMSYVVNTLKPGTPVKKYNKTYSRTFLITVSSLPSLKSIPH